METLYSIIALIRLVHFGHSRQLLQVATMTAALQKTTEREKMGQYWPRVEQAYC